MKLIKTIINRGRDFGMMPNSDLFVLLDQPYFIKPTVKELPKTWAERFQDTIRDKNVHGAI